MVEAAKQLRSKLVSLRERKRKDREKGIEGQKRKRNERKGRVKDGTGKVGRMKVKQKLKISRGKEKIKGRENQCLTTCTAMNFLAS